MKPIVMNEKEKNRIIKNCIKSLKESFNDFCFMDGQEFAFKIPVGEKLKDKIRIVYSPSAYLKMTKLVQAFDSEVSWFGLIEHRSPLEYYIYDVIVPKQQVDGAKVDTDDDEMLEFYSNLTDEQAEHLHFQAHSHVNFDTKASGTDSENQMDILSNIPNQEGFYMFQIWNKKGDINTYLYDLDENKFYDRNDVEIVVEDEEYGDLDTFIAESKKLVSKIVKPVTYYTGYPTKSSGYGYYYNYPVHNDYGYSKGYCWPEEWTDEEEDVDELSKKL